MKFRPHRGSLSAAMLECVELPATREAIADHCNILFPYEQVKPENVQVKFYAFDERIGWNTYIVTYHTEQTPQGVLGFTNGPVTE